MNELIERFLQYIYRRNSQSEKTVDAYKRDLTQFKEYLESQGITNFEDVDRLTFMNFLMELRVLPDGTSAKNSTIARKISTYRSFYRYLNISESMPTRFLQSRRLKIKEKFQISYFFQR